MFKSQEVLSKCKIHAFITFVTLTTLARCYDSTTLNVSEGEVSQLNFTYPCDSTRVTLRYSYRYPFYSSANPHYLSLPPNHVLRDRNDTNIGNCWLYLTIDPVLRDNEGTYILTAYKNGKMLPEYPRIGIRVKYPPGKASCETSEKYTDGEWVSLQCTAPVGTLAGQIVCYQNGMKLPSLTNPAQGRRTLTQTILARLADPVYCCSCSLEQNTDMCDCKDCKLDPFERSAFTNTTDPCPAALTTQHLMSSQDTGSLDGDNSSLLTSLSIPNPVPKTNCPVFPVYYVAVVILCVSFIIILVLYICKVRQAKRLKEINKCKCVTSDNLKSLNSKEQDHQSSIA